MYQQRWAVEDSFKVTKERLGWQEVQVPDLWGIRTLVVIAWVGAGFLYQLGVTLEWAEVQLLAKLGGWVPHKDRHPGKITLMWGLRHLLDMLATQAILTEAAAQPRGSHPISSPFCKAGNLLHWIYDQIAVHLFLLHQVI